MSAPRLSVIIPTQHRAKALGRALDSLDAQQDAPEFEIIVVIDGADADTEALLASRSATPPLRFERSPAPRGLAAARDLGARSAHAPLLLFLDDDCVVGPEWVAGHLHAHSDDVRRVVMGRIENVYEFPPRHAAEQFTREMQDAWFAQLWSALQQNPAAAENYWVGLNTSLPRSVYMECGGYDARLLLNEETELAERMAAQGIPFAFEPQLEVTHIESKRLDEERVRRASIFAECEMLRLIDLQHQTAAWPMLGSLHFGTKWYWRWKDRFAWYFPRSSEIIGRRIIALANMTGSRTAFKVGDALRFSSRYWRQVRKRGMSLSELRDLCMPEWQRRTAERRM